MSSPAPRPAAPRAGAAFGPWELVRELGRGGMGAVFLARERGSGREVALKVMLDPLSATPTERERFRREAQVAAGLTHPGIVRVHAAGEEEGRAWFACELVEGAVDLASAARELPLLERARLVAQAARALGHAHARGVVHRDVKPENLLVDAAGRLRVADFGVSAALTLERLTRTGDVVGTPRYMAPEQIDGQKELVGPPTDVWALGVLLHELLSGQPLFRGGSLPLLFGQIVREPVPDLRRAVPEAPAGLAEVCARALAKAPGERYPHATALAEDLERVLSGGETLAGAARRARRRRRALTWLAGLGLLGAGAALAARLATGRPLDQPSPPPAPAPTRVEEAPALELPAGADGWLLLGPEQEHLELRGAAAGCRLTARVDGRPLEGAALPLRLPLAPGAWTRFELALVDARGVTRARREGGALRLPAHLERVDATTARARDGYELLLVPPPAAGEFQRPALREGNLSVAQGATWGRPAEGPLDEARRVELAHPFLLGRCEVSRAEYAGATGDEARLPALDLLRTEAEAHAGRLGLALPTLDEWTWAALGGEQLRPWPWGTQADRARANFQGEEDGARAACPVDALPAGAGRWGHLHLAGNVFEWVAGGADDDAFGGLAARGLCLGGSYGAPWPPAATTLRASLNPGVRSSGTGDVGCRLAWRPAAR